MVSMDHRLVGGAISVTDALSMMSLTEEMKQYITERQSTWEVFGKMNSHMYRGKLMRMMDQNKLSKEAKFMVFFMFSVIKNQARVLTAMDGMNAEDMKESWFPEVRNFVATQITQYVSDVTRSKKFPAVNIPTCNPGLDVLVYCLITHPNDRNMKDLSTRPTFSQLKLSEELQLFAKEGVKIYWNSIVSGTKNPDAATMNLPAPEFREDYYKNAASDDYLLVDENLNELPPDSENYTLEEIFEYLISVSQVEDYSSSKSILHNDMLSIFGDEVEKWPVRLKRFFNHKSREEIDEERKKKEKEMEDKKDSEPGPSKKKEGKKKAVEAEEKESE